MTLRRPLVGVALAAVAVILCWAYSPIGIRIGLRAYAPGQLALMRFLIASAFLAVAAGVSGISRPRPGDLPLFLVFGFFAVTLHHIALNTGQRFVSAGASSVLAQSTPIFTVLIARFALEERVSAWRWGCVLAGMAGACVVIVGDKGFGPVDAHALLILVAALSWSVYFALQKQHSQRYSALTMTCFTVWSGTMQLCVYIPGLLTQAQEAPLDVNLAVTLLGVFPSALAYLLWAHVLEHSEVSRATPILYAVPPVAMLMAAVLLHEPTPWLVIIGGLLVVGSVVVLHLEASISPDWQPPRTPDRGSPGGP